MNIAAILEEQARRSGDRLAIVEPSRSVTFGALNCAVASAAAELADAGIGAGTRALVFGRMSIPLYVTMIALFRRRATAVFVDPSAGRERLDACVRRISPGAFVAIPKAHLLRFTSPAVRSIPKKLVIGGRVPLATVIGRGTSARTSPVEDCPPDTPAIITFTSGSTGEPKAAVRSHGFLIAQHRALVESIALEAGQVDLCTLPIFLLANLASGITSVIPDADLRAPGRIDAGPVMDQISQWRPDRTVASPALLLRLAAFTEHSGRPLDSFTRIYTGGAPVFPSTLDAIGRAAPHATITALYGSTEAEPIAHIDRSEISADDRSRMVAGQGLLTGRPVQSIHLRIVRDQWGTPLPTLTPDQLHALSLDPRQPGEIVVAGDHVLDGYLDGRGNDETKIRVDRQTWHRTGDAGYLDEQGRLWLLGRCSAKAADKEGVLYPFAVECAASEHPRVARAAFAFHRGRRVLAVELREDAPNATSELRRRLGWAHLDVVVKIPRIPVDRRHNAKVDYPALAELLDGIIS